MHIHGNQLNVQAAEFSAISSGEVAARRAAEVRKRLLKSAASINAGGSDELPLSGQWMDAFHSQVLSEDEYRGGEKGKDPDFG